jgi:hypothetical protein
MSGTNFASIGATGGMTGSFTWPFLPGVALMANELGRGERAVFQ